MLVIMTSSEIGGSSEVGETAIENLINTVMYLIIIYMLGECKIPNTPKKTLIKFVGAKKNDSCSNMLKKL